MRGRALSHRAAGRRGLPPKARGRPSVHSGLGVPQLGPSERPSGPIAAAVAGGGRLVRPASHAVPGSRRCRSAASAARTAASVRLPRWSMTVMSQRTDHTRLLGTTQSASTSIAWLLRMARSSSLVSSTAASLGRPGSKTGEAIGENSTENCSNPSAGRSWYGSTSSAVAVASTRVWPSRNSHVPGTAAPNSMWIGRTSSSRRPSTRKPFSSARRMNASSLLLMASERGCCMLPAAGGRASPLAPSADWTPGGTPRSSELRFGARNTKSCSQYRP